MYTLVIPTMWKYEPFIEFLEELVEHYLVDEVLIIDNDSRNRPKSDILYDPKITFIHDSGTNIFVNPAWNLGVEKAKNDYICILNDDVVFDLRLFVKMLPFIKHENFGAAGAHPGEEHLFQHPYRDGMIDIIPWVQPEPGRSHGHLFGFGTLFFVRKDNWFPIPDTMLIYCGDDWVHFTQKTYDRDIFLITNMFYTSPSAQTCSNIMTEEEREHVMIKEQTAFKEAIPIFRDEAYQGYIEGEFEYGVLHKSEINEHLLTLRKLSSECESVVELGVREGWSTRAFLTQRNKFRAYDLIRWTYINHLFDTMRNIGRDFEYIQADTLALDLKPCDMIFFNTKRTYEQLSKELELHGNKAQKYLVFHDVVTYGNLLTKAINEFMENNAHWVEKERYYNNNGLLILERN